MKLTKPHAAVMYAMALSPTQVECMLWTGAKDQRGYGRVRIGKVQERIHRVVFMMVYGFFVAPNMRVLHRCDTPSCYNPRHLFLGTQVDNVKDMISKGRGWWQKKRGTKTLT